MKMGRGKNSTGKRHVSLPGKIRKRDFSPPLEAWLCIVRPILNTLTPITNDAEGLKTEVEWIHRLFLFPLVLGKM